MSQKNRRIICDKFADLMTALQALKPDDRSALDRRWAVTTTLTEQAYGYFYTFADAPEQEVESEVAPGR